MSLIPVDMTREECQEIIQFAKAGGVYDDFLKGVSFTCDKCEAFVVKTPVLMNTLERLIAYLDADDFSYEDDATGDFVDAFWSLRAKIVKPIILTDEEWSRYFTHGLKEYCFAYDNKNNLMTDYDGNPLAYVSDEVAVEFSDKCECTQILNQMKEAP